MSNASLAALAVAIGALALPSLASAGNYLDDMAQLDAQIALQRKQIEARNLAIEAAGRTTLPRVRYVSGFEDDLSAVLAYANGRRLTVKRGETLPGGLEVKAVRYKGVIVSVGKELTLLEFVAPAQDGTAGAALQQEQHVGPMPPLPQVNVPLPSNLGRWSPTAEQPAKQTPAPAAATPAQAPRQPTAPNQQGAPLRVQGQTGVQAAGTQTSQVSQPAAQAPAAAPTPVQPAATATATPGVAAPAAGAELAIGRAAPKN